MKQVFKNEKKKEICNAAALGMFNAGIEAASESTDSKPSVDWTDSQIEKQIKSDFNKKNKFVMKGQKWKFLGVETLYGIRYINYQSPQDEKVSVAWSKMVK